MSILPSCVCVHHICAWEESLRSDGTVLKLWATMWVAGLEPRSSKGAASAVNGWAVSPALNSDVKPSSDLCTRTRLNHCNRLKSFQTSACRMGPWNLMTTTVPQRTAALKEISQIKGHQQPKTKPYSKFQWLKFHLDNTGFSVQNISY